MRKSLKKQQARGSVTVEACMVLPIYLSLFFLLMFIVRLTCTGMLLDHAANETAKEIATSAYPISFINEFEDAKLEQYGDARIPSLEEELEKLRNQYWGAAPGDTLGMLISEDFNGEKAAKTLQGILSDYRKGIIGGILGSITPKYWDMKAAGKYYIADALMREHLGSPLLEQEFAKLRLVEFPQGMAEFETRSRSGAYKQLGLTPGKDFGAEDVVIQLEYDYNVKLPFMEERRIKLVHTAVERAWINGSFGIIAEKDEGFELEPKGRIVFVTRTGIRYHLGNCRYLRKSKFPIDMEAAKAEGYTPCKVCRPGTGRGEGQ